MSILPSYMGSTYQYHRYVNNNSEEVTQKSLRVGVKVGMILRKASRFSPNPKGTHVFGQ